MKVKNSLALTSFFDNGLYLCYPVLIVIVLFIYLLLQIVYIDEFKSFFSKYGKVVEHEIIRDHVTKRSRGFGFIVFDNEQVVDNILTDGNMIDMGGTQVSILCYQLFLYEAVHVEQLYSVDPFK